MKSETMQRLNAINQAFYEVTASEFDATRGQAWLGWLPLLEYIQRLPRPAKILDVGCGNGRFGAMIAQENIPMHYHGVDSSRLLLRVAKNTLERFPNITYELDEQDVVTQVLPLAKYHFVGLFGVLHHIPSAQFRLNFMKQLAQRVAVGGFLVFASWRFYEDEKFRERIVEWDDDIVHDVERNDYLLDWRRGERALRYCHYVDDAEQHQLIEATGLQHLETYRADGASNRLNCYSVLVK
jgi:tRNA (uracil-5-)-methyltransferase TRM9